MFLQWDRYMLCDGSPNPTVEPEINTFIALWKEDPEVDIQIILKQCSLALQLIDELDIHLSEETEPGLIQMYQDTLQCLQSLIYVKHQMAAEKILKSARSCADFETGNMQMMVRDENFTVCLWANIEKNPRLVSYNFQEAGLSFELPKQLALSDVCLRFLHTRYDHLTPVSLLMQAQNKSLATEEEAEADSETPKALNDEMVTEEREGKESVQQEKDDLQSLKSSEGRKSKASVSSAKTGRKGSSVKSQKKTEEHSEEDKADLEPTVVEPGIESDEPQIMDLHQYTPLGGVYYFNLFHLPPQTLTINGWEVTELSQTGLQDFPFSPEQPPSSVSAMLEDRGPVSYPPVGVTVVLPESVIFMQEPKVARWDPVGHHWQRDGITDTSFNSEAHSMSFKMDSFYPFTFLQETHINMPFQSWELRPQGQDSVMLTITAALTEVRISVQGNQCLLEMDQAPALNHILGKWMSLSALQRAMTHAGVNIFVKEYSDKFVTVNAKDPLIEHAVYEQMALVSSVFAFSRSRWNAQCGQEHVVLQVCEHLEAGPVPEEAWSLYLLGAQRFQCLKMTEASAAFSPQLAQDTEFHSTFLHMLRDFISPEGRDRLDHTHYILVNTVQRLLCATRLLIFS
ncbi:dynein axonemal intermediate chain 7 isoform X1 [Clarias gariepinus]|uniref:dynein axonemal intermediate chain 7 isoform X1 n=1 Tax=Clarias gariepinus TaxID=13013 RepID=UPI00234C4C44|nr:dynein axonemal intermediate chain 7 isoform X1 [Clarias gariepinus]